MKHLWIPTLILAMTAGMAPAKTIALAEEPKIQMAILLDTSGSMDGLINQARAQIWTVVNEFALTEKNGKRPLLEIALYHYGNDGLDIKSHYVKQLVPFTDDLDLISQKLFALQTDGGSEYCGAVIGTAMEELNWSRNNDDYKVIFIAGNEPFTQGSVDYKEACSTAIGKGVMVNTLFCGENAEGVRTMWQDGAQRADGKYLSINHNAVEIHIDAPQDKDLVKLNEDLNGTYIAYGREGQKYALRQQAEDSNVQSVSSKGFFSRVKSKSGRNYSNASWDLCDANRLEKLDISKVDVKDLPENMQKMTVKEREQYVKDMIAKRQDIQKKINELTAARAKYVSEELTKKQKEGAEDLGGVVVTTVREQAESRNYTFKSE